MLYRCGKCDVEFNTPVKLEKPVSIYGPNVNSSPCCNYHFREIGTISMRCSYECCRLGVGEAAPRYTCFHCEKFFDQPRVMAGVMSSPCCNHHFRRSGASKLGCSAECCPPYECNHCGKLFHEPKTDNVDGFDQPFSPCCKEHFSDRESKTARSSCSRLCCSGKPSTVPPPVVTQYGDPVALEPKHAQRQPGMNHRRAARARVALHAYGRAIRCGEGEDPETLLSDLLGDLMHHADEKGIVFEDVVDRARRMYQQENCARCKLCLLFFDAEADEGSLEDVCVDCLRKGKS